MNESPFVDSSFAVLVFSPGDDPIACLNKAIAFLTAVASLRYKSNATSFGGNNASGQMKSNSNFLKIWEVPDGQAIQTIIPNNATFQTEDLDTYDSVCDDISNAQVVLVTTVA
ncbi:hypothetical protein Tco_1163009 [Tanacetum coccineum]